MRALLVPQVVTSELVAESEFGTYGQLIHLLAEYEPSFSYLWSLAKHADAPRVWSHAELFAESSTSAFHQQACSVTGRLFELFNRLTGVYPIDAVFTSRAGLVPSLMAGLATLPSAPVPCVLVEPRVYGPGDVYAHNMLSETDNAARSLGYALALTVYWSEWEKREGLRSVQQWLSPAAYERATERSRVIPLVVDVPPGALNRRPREKKRLLFAGRLNPNKRYREVLDAYAKVYQSRCDVDVWIHGGTASFRKLPAPFNRWHRTSERLPLQQWHELLSTANVSAYASYDEGSCVTALELLACGVVMALPCRPWVMKLFYPLKYPFQFGSFRELPAMLDYLLDNEESCRVQLEPIRQLIRSRHNPEQWKAGWQTVFDEVKALNAAGRIAPLRVFREEAQRLISRDGSASFATVLSASRVARTRPQRKVAFSNYAAWLAVRDLDDHETAIPLLRMRHDDGSDER